MQQVPSVDEMTLWTLSAAYGKLWWLDTTFGKLVFVMIFITWGLLIVILVLHSIDIIRRLFLLRRLFTGREKKNKN